MIRATQNCSLENLWKLGGLGDLRSSVFSHPDPWKIIFFVFCGLISLRVVPYLILIWSVSTPRVSCFRFPKLIRTLIFWEPFFCTVVLFWRVHLRPQFFGNANKFCTKVMHATRFFFFLHDLKVFSLRFLAYNNIVGR